MTAPASMNGNNRNTKPPNGRHPKQPKPLIRVGRIDISASPESSHIVALAWRTAA
jgi:hypothetical protein